MRDPHADITRWSDYVRGLVTGSERAAMREHLDAGCERCGSTVAALKRVVDLEVADGAITLPSFAVRSAKAYFALRSPEGRRRLATVVLERLFDSDIQPAAVPTRAERQGTRLMRFESADYAVDVRMDPPGEAGTAVVAGQCLDRRGEPVASTPALLMAGGELASQDLTGDHGQFALTTHSAGGLELWLLVGDDERLLLRLPEE